LAVCGRHVDSMPEELQGEMVKPSGAGARIVQHGYAIEYGSSARPNSGRTRDKKGLFRRPDQWHHGLRPPREVAGIVQRCSRAGPSSFLARELRGILIDDLVTRGAESYRVLRPTRSAHIRVVNADQLNPRVLVWASPGDAGL
jgi:tRNA U34 5-carboxymethylaminomethyl modifying enzyme MnmG/GidA